MRRAIAFAITMIQLLLAARFLSKVRSTAGGRPIERRDQQREVGLISVIVPVLNEIDRVDECLESLRGQGSDVVEILVVDGGSDDGTQLLVEQHSQLDPRIQLLSADPIAEGWNGKSWGLQVALGAVSGASDWVVTVDADVTVSADGIASAVSFAETRGIPFLSIATSQQASTPGLSLIHPSLLSTLVYRFGIPGQAARTLDEVQANGQFAVYQRQALQRNGGFSIARDSICEDVTLARHLFLSGYQVGFFEGGDLAVTRMYANGLECLRNWPRSLSLQDRFAPRAGVIGLLNIAFLQVLPVLSLIWMPASFRAIREFSLVNRLLLGARLGIMLGTRRAYADVHWVYWLSPLCDPVSLIAYAMNLSKRSHTWRGRRLVIRKN